jgi:hypothetical protein
MPHHKCDIAKAEGPAGSRADCGPLHPGRKKRVNIAGSKGNLLNKLLINEEK